MDTARTLILAEVRFAMVRPPWRSRKVCWYTRAMEPQEGRPCTRWAKSESPSQWSGAQQLYSPASARWARKLEALKIVHAAKGLGGDVLASLGRDF